MRKSILSCILIFYGLSTFAQVQHRDGYIGLTAGPSIPLSNYADNDRWNPEAGFATNGLSININFNYKFSRKIGLALLWKGDAHPMDVDKIKELSIAQDPDAYWDIEAKPWGAGAFLVGLMFSQPAGKIDIDLRGVIGIGSTTYPKMTITSIKGNEIIESTQHEYVASSFAFNLGAGVKIPVSDAIAFNICADYYRTKPDFEVLVTTNYGHVVEGYYTQIIKAMNITFGLGYRIK